MRAGGGRAAAPASGAAVRPSSRHSKQDPSADDHAAVETLPVKANRPRGRPPQKPRKVPSTAAATAVTANGTAASQGKPPGRVASVGRAAISRSGKQILQPQMRTLEQSKQGSKQHRGPRQKQKPAAAVAAVRVDAAAEQRSKRKRKRPARFDDNSSGGEEADDRQEVSILSGSLFVTMHASIR